MDRKPLYITTLSIVILLTLVFIIGELSSQNTTSPSTTLDNISVTTQTAALGDLTSGLVAHYTFDDASNLGADSSGNGNNGTPVNGPTATTGKVGSGAVDLTGGKSISLGDLSAVEGQMALSVSAWVKNNQSANVTGADSIVKKEGSGADTFQLHWTQSEDINYCIIGTGGTSCSGTNSANSQYTKGIPDGSGTAWHLVTGVYDASLGTVTVYVDGVPGSYVGSLTLPTQNSVHAIVIGGTWDGVIDDVRIYNRALSASEVQQLYTEGGGTTGGGTTDNTGGSSTTGDTSTTGNTSNTSSGNTSTSENTSNSNNTSSNTSNTNSTPPVQSVRTPAPPPISWTPPIGIPEPPFGIRETHFMYQLGTNETCTTNPNKCYDFGNGLEPYRDAGSGPYTHYVDNTFSNSTDSNNPYGTPEKPRKTIPYNLPAGTVVEVHGGPYSYANYGGSKLGIKADGTQARPVFVRGPSSSALTVFGRIISARGSYLIIENVKTDGSIHFRTDTTDVDGYNHHLVFRHSESNYSTQTTSYVSGVKVRNVVFFDNHIHGNQQPVTYLDGTTGTFDPTSTKEFKEADRIGLAIGPWTENVWILDNDIHDMTGDAVGTGHAAGYTVKNYYIGRNKLHDTGENGVDLKEVENFVVSQNDIYNFKGGSSGSDGTPVVIHYGPQLSPINAWFLFNNIHDSLHSGIQVGGDQKNESYFIGNVVYDISNSSYTGKGFITWHSAKINMINNVFYNNDNGVNISGDGSPGPLIFKNNIISNIKNPNGYFFSMSGTAYTSISDINNNIFYQPDRPVSMSSNRPTLSQFKTSIGKCSSCIEADPQFTNPTSGDFRLKSTSPAIDAGDTALLEDLASRYYASFGVDIRKDILGNNRFAGSNVDIGAYEYCTGSNCTTTPPSSSTCTSFTYSAWSTCTNGTQSRTITSSSPTSCTGGSPVTTQSCSISTLLGDFDHNNIVNSLDLSLLTSKWNQSNTTYDLTGDNLINTLDYVVMVKNWTR